MARNEEKSHSMLNKWVDSKKRGSESARRPHLASECDNLRECEKWRREILQDVGRKVTQIQNASIGEHRIRELNDEINKLIRIKGHWERQIIALGGPNHFLSSARILDGDGKEVSGGGGYRYFGAAKELPGVKELFEKDAPPPLKRSRKEINEGVNADYYGFRDDDDGLLEAAEIVAEKAALNTAWSEFCKNKGGPVMEADAEGDFDDGLGDSAAGAAGTEQPLRAHVVLPSQDDIEAQLLKKRKQELLDRYTGADYLAEQAAVKELRRMGK